MSGLNWEILESAVLRREPFEHFHVNDALSPDCAAAVWADYPDIRDSGSYSLSDAPPGPALKALIADLESDRFRRVVERVFAIDLTDRPTLVTLRGHCSARDGRIHTDSRTKIVSLLLYLNRDWRGGEGQLRLLRDRADINSEAVEIPAAMGSLVAFRRSDRSWHGHSRYVGPRRVLQLNYLRSTRASFIGGLRHRLSALAKGRPGR
ncbi:2OG-Fe(II) oxygenase [Phenylobacterium sp.]|uniref:2OG-Fe(II) oxygenase n=1 Tax=Phenylobacterium sp. TaxID=1871053 RepID=UPI00286B9F1E|nr:2OG-Fe(II) oxygenase [Phenylobacterium sp.]